MVYEIAARSSFDLGDLKVGLDYAHQFLALLPENPLFLVAVAHVQAREYQNDAAISSARDSLDYLDRFARPVARRVWLARDQTEPGSNSPLRHRSCAHTESTRTSRRQRPLNPSR